MRGAWAIAGACLLVHLACGENYGFFRDELYFVVCGQRLSWGYVDQPPAAALLARLAWWLSGDGGSVLRFRLPAMAAHVGLVLLSGATARRLGGGAWAIAIAAVCTACAPVALAQGHLVSMNILEMVLWSGAVYALLGAAQGDTRAWPLAGALLGAAALTKYSVGFLIGALAVGLTVTSPRRWRARGPAAAAAIAALIAAPTVAWQLAHDLPFLELLRNGRAYKNAVLSPADVVGGVLLEQGPLALVIALAGAAHLIRAREARFVGVALALVLLVMVLMGAKPYYLAPLFPPLFAAGAVLSGELSARWPRARWALAAVLVAEVVPAAPLAIPLLSPERAVAWKEAIGVEPKALEKLESSDLPQHFADQLGWRARAEAVSALWAALPPRPHAVVYVSNYGRAAALELFGRGLPPVISGHNQYYLWAATGGPPDAVAVLAVGGRREDYRAFARVELIGHTPAIAHGMPYESSLPVYWLESPTVPLPELLRATRHFE